MLHEKEGLEVKVRKRMGQSPHCRVIRADDIVCDSISTDMAAQSHKRCCKVLL